MKKDTCIIVGPQALPTLLKSIACRKGAYPNLIVHSPKRPRRTQGDLMDATNPPICQQLQTCRRISKRKSITFLP